MEKAAARQISELMLEYYAKLDASVQLVRDRCSEEEFKKYREAIGLIMGYMTTEVMVPLYKKNPDLEPPGFKA